MEAGGGSELEVVGVERELGLGWAPHPSEARPAGDTSAQPPRSRKVFSLVFAASAWSVLSVGSQLPPSSSSTRSPNAISGSPWSWSAESGECSGHGEGDGEGHDEGEVEGEAKCERSGVGELKLPGLVVRAHLARLKLRSAGKALTTERSPPSLSGRRTRLRSSRTRL